MRAPGNPLISPINNPRILLISFMVATPPNRPLSGSALAVSCSRQIFPSRVLTGASIHCPAPSPNRLSLQAVELLPTARVHSCEASTHHMQKTRSVRRADAGMTKYALGMSEVQEVACINATRR